MNLNVTVNTQSSIRIAGKDTVIRFDPYLIAGEPHDTDIIFLTHDHYDHFSPDDIRKVIKPDTVIAAPKHMGKQLAALKPADVVLLAPGETAEIGTVLIETVAAYNTLKPFHPKSSGNLGYVITLDGQRIYAAALVNMIRPKTAIPIHYGSIVGKPSDGEAFRKLVAEGIETKLLLAE